MAYTRAGCGASRRRTRWDTATCNSDTGRVRLQPPADFIAVSQEKGGLIMADEDVDVVIVGSGFAGALIANELASGARRW